MSNYAKFKRYDGTKWVNINIGNNVHYIAGTGSITGTWLGSDDTITKYYDGLTIAYKIPISGAATTTLNINGLGAKTVRINDQNFTTNLPVNSVVILVYTTISNTGYWVWSNYNTVYSLTGEKTFVTSISGGSGSLTSNTTSTNGLKYIENVTYSAPTLNTTTNQFITEINGGSGELTSSTTRASINDIIYISSITYTASSVKTTGTVGINGGSSSLTGTYDSTNKKLTLSVSYTAPTLSGTKTFVTAINGGSISNSAKYLHHTHNAASSKTTADGLSSATIENGSVSSTTKYLHHTHNAASIIATGTVELSSSTY